MRKSIYVKTKRFFSTLGDAAISRDTLSSATHETSLLGVAALKLIHIYFSKKQVTVNKRFPDFVLSPCPGSPFFFEFTIVYYYSTYKHNMSNYFFHDKFFGSYAGHMETFPLSLGTPLTVRKPLAAFLFFCNATSCGDALFYIGILSNAMPIHFILIYVEYLNY